MYVRRGLHLQDIFPFSDELTFDDAIGRNLGLIMSLSAEQHNLIFLAYNVQILVRFVN